MEKKIDVVYKLGSGSTFNNAELRYSLRSLQNFIPLRNVYIVGFLPDFIQNVIHIKAEDPYKQNKDGNLISKLILATLDQNLSEEFVNMSDDQMFLQKCDYDEIKVPYINNKHFVDLSKGAKPNRWQIRLNRTVDKLKEKRLPHDCFEAHVPYLLNKINYANTLFMYDYGMDRGYVGNSLYYNTLLIKGRELESNTLVRLIESIEDRNVLESVCNGKKYLNYTDAAINDNLFLYLQKTFPVKSKYEK